MNFGFLLILFFVLFYSEKNILLFLLYSKHVIKLSGYILGCYRRTLGLANVTLGVWKTNKRDYVGIVIY